MQEAMYISSSVRNFDEKLRRRFNIPRWHFLQSMGKPSVFFGMYNPVDYLRFLWHRGPRTVFWAGGDVVNTSRRRWWQLILRSVKARHICENIVEHRLLAGMGIHAEIHPCLVDRVTDERTTFKHSDTPEAYLCAHKGREAEYGVYEFLRAAEHVPGVIFHIYGIDGYSYDNVVFHGKVPGDQFDRETAGYQAAVRLNEIDGFSEILARAMLRGQHGISRIPYMYMAHAPDFESLIRKLKDLKKQPANLAGRAYWKKELQKSFEEILC